MAFPKYRSDGASTARDAAQNRRWIADVALEMVERPRARLREENGVIANLEYLYIAPLVCE